MQPIEECLLSTFCRTGNRLPYCTTYLEQERLALVRTNQTHNNRRTPTTTTPYHLTSHSNHQKQAEGHSQLYVTQMEIRAAQLPPLKQHLPCLLLGRLPQCLAVVKLSWRNSQQQTCLRSTALMPPALLQQHFNTCQLPKSWHLATQGWAALSRSRPPACQIQRMSKCPLRSRLAARCLFPGNPPMPLKTAVQHVLIFFDGNHLYVRL